MKQELTTFWIWGLGTAFLVAGACHRGVQKRGAEGTVFGKLPDHNDLIGSVREIADRVPDPPEGLWLTGSTAHMWHDVALRDAALMQLRRAVSEADGRPVVLIEWGAVASADYSAALLVDQEGSGRLWYVATDFDPKVPRVCRHDIEQYEVASGEVALVRELVMSGEFVGDFRADVMDGAGFFISYWKCGKRNTVPSWALEFTEDLSEGDEEGQGLPRETRALSELVSRVITVLAAGRRHGREGNSGDTSAVRPPVKRDLPEP